MSNKLQPLRGTKDLLPEDFKKHEYIINIAGKIGELYGYEPMSTPIVEYANIFDRTLGDSSDIINKEMYSFLDKSNENIALRPEFTAGVVRAFISNSLTHNLPLKFFSHGPVFRYDRPQAGRQRQFHQINFEYLGAEGTYTDAETIKLASDILATLKINNQVVLELNSLGCNESRQLYRQQLIAYFNDHKSLLSEDSIKRLAINPMRILDSKDENDKKIVQHAPIIADCYTDLAKKYWENVLKYLESLAVDYIINPRLVRGLDYYCHTAFEFTTTSIGSQSTVLAGGRYDGLSEIMGGAATPAIGFAAGIERLALMCHANIDKTRPIFVLPIGEDNLTTALKVSDSLRQAKLQIIMDAKGKIDKRLMRALKQEARYAIFIGDEERLSGQYKLKDLDNREEVMLSISDIIQRIKN